MLAGKRLRCVTSDWHDSHVLLRSATAAYNPSLCYSCPAAGSAGPPGYPLLRRVPLPPGALSTMSPALPAALCARAREEGLCPFGGQGLRPAARLTRGARLTAEPEPMPSAACPGGAALAVGGGFPWGGLPARRQVGALEGHGLAVGRPRPRLQARPGLLARTISLQPFPGTHSVPAHPSCALHERCACAWRLLALLQHAARKKQHTPGLPVTYLRPPPYPQGCWRDCSGGPAFHGAAAGGHLPAPHGQDGGHSQRVSMARGSVALRRGSFSLCPPRQQARRARLPLSQCQAKE